MVRIVGAELAIVDPAKVAGYILSPTHRTGRHKARVFAAALGIGQTDADTLIRSLHDAVEAGDATLRITSIYGEEYEISYIMRNGDRSATVRSFWIVRSSERFPRFVTAFVAKTERQV